MADDKCVEAATGPIVADEPAAQAAQATTVRKESAMQAQVGKAAPDFELTAFAEGGFKNVRLSSYKGQWVVLCFYPGDFTFV
jgi:peroxiredoxin (alkyl hydroperoxide reductase subunit C)